MTYLAKVRKCDLSKLAYELGEVVPPESRIVDLKHLILNSQSYEEEFAKQLLETLIEEREQTERAERERMEQTAQTEQAERIERERKEQMVMEFELEKLRIQTTRGNNDTSRSTSNDAHYEIRKLMPKYESKDNDLSFYLILFERQAKRLGLDEDQWAFSLLGLLPYEMTQLIARETEEQSGDYRFVKRLLLKRYKLSPEQFRQKFEKHERSQKGSWRDFAFELRGYFNEWIEGMNVENFDALKDLSVTNQLKKKVPNVLRNHLIDDWTKLNNPDELADKLDEYENVRTEMGPPHWNAKHLIPPSFQQKSARFPNQSEVKETKQGTNVSGQDAARNEISETYPNTLRRMVNRTIRNDKGEPKCFNCNQFGHIARDCPAPRTTLTCRGCGQTGHKERNCTRPKEGLKVANLEVEGLETVPPDVYLKDVKIDNKETVKAMIDTGSSSCLMRESVARRISVDIEPDSTSLYGIGNQTAPAARTVGKTTVDLEIDGIVGREITVFIVNDDAQPYDLLIGRTWTDLPYVSFARIGKNLHIGYSSEFPFANLQEEIKSRRIELRATETVQLESDSINFTSAITDEVKDGYVLFTGVDDACVDSLLEVVDGKTTVPIISAGKGKLRVRKNQCVGRVELLNLDGIVVNLDVAEDSFQTKNEEKREGQDQMKRKRPILPEDINVNHSLTSKERQEILDVVNEYRDCFALGMEELGCTDVTKMDIKEVDGSKPVCLRPYKTTASERETIREIVREWKDNGIVTETRSPYASPVLLVRKKTGDHRLVVDYRRLNIQTVKDKFPLPRIDDLLEGLRNAKFFTTLDLAHGYLQIPLTDKAKLKTAFITPDDTGQFERMIFGLANAPAEFQRLMHTVLGPLLNKKAFCYLDDVIIPAKDWREMIERLREVLERIRSAKLTLKPSKCEFGRREVEFLGYVISTGGLKPGPRKIKAIEEFPEPKNVHDIRRFLGLTNFFRRFVKDFARKAEPLSRLTKKGSQFEWKEEQRRSFGGLRKDLVEYPVLAHYNPELKTEVHCDASAEGLAGMVLQMDEDCKWRLVYCVSKKTTEAEKMYHSSKLELMAIVWTLDRLPKVRKCDLSKLAYELGEVVPPESRIVDLKHLILNSQSYEEEFAKQLLETLIEEREQTERAERERMEQTAQTEQAERIERERKEQMVMEFELEKLRIQTTRGNNDTSRSTSNDAHYEIRKLMPKYESKDNDLSFYLILFERQAKRLGLDEDQWAFSLLGLLPYEMTQLIARETEEQSGDYRFVKRLLLKRYKLSPEQFRQKFEKHERSQKGSWRDFAFELRGYFNEWIEGMNVENFDALKDLSVTNQLKKKVPNVLRNHLIDDWTKLNNPDELADKLDEYENVRTEMGPPHWNAKHLIPPSFQQKSARFPNQSEVKETKQGTNVSGQDAARNEISETYPNTLRRMVNRTIRNDKGEPKCFNCNQFGHIARDCPAPRTTLTCRGCGQTGHKERNCTRPKEGLKVANLEVEGLETVPPDVYLKDVKIDNKETVKAMIDTGSSSCLMRESVARRISVDIEPDSTSLYGIGNQTAPAARTVGKTTVDLEIDGIVGREITVFIVNDDAQPYDLLIGRTWTDLPYVSFARIGKNLHIGYSSEFPFANLQEEIKSRRIELRATETVQLESDSINFTSAITDEVKDGYVLFTGVDDACVDSLLEVVDGKTTVPIISAGKGKLRVRKNQCVGRVELLNLDGIVVNLDVAEDSFQTKNEEKREGQDQMKRKRPILPEDINVNHSLTSKERQEILDVVNEYRDCFALGMEELGCTDVTKMDIKEVDGSKPVCLRPYKTTASERETIREIVREWKDNGIVTETRSPYASPVLLVRKKTGDHRLVVDYRRLNIQTVKDKFPLPRIDDLLEGLRNAKFFTTLDLAHGYLQIPLTDKAKLKTAFITPDDTGQFERMIFGLANAPAEFQRLMHTVLGPLLNKKAFCYLDDVIIPAKDWREMIERLREVLERIRSAKLTLKPSKCEFGRREVEFLGYVISTGGLKPGPRKIKAIEEFPEPKNVHDIRRFLGLTNFFRRFVKDFARKAEPLSRLTKKGSQFEWKEEQRRSFGGLRKDLVEYPVLAHYNPELKTEVHCDASAEGLAGMVLQMDEDCKWRLVYCVSKKTTEAEKMYHSSKLELMAIVWTLDRLRQFLVGIKFTLVTDCQALVYMNAKKTTNPQIARWYNLIQEYDFEIRHKPGEKMAHVDGMSRAPVDDPRDTMKEIVEKNLEVCLTITLEEQILMIQHSDPELRNLIQIFRKDPCDRTVGEQNRINDYSYRRKSGRGARSRRYPRRNPRRSCNARFNRGRLKSRNGRM
ncbi:hypothetical protein LAZ67_1006716 [Cordylochernes scorpioides]|uniref:RNA-directed DNA polymerase n=1 Tax=Cordylochernes scorpioides TaxID=51811 RepID=A0ABY6K2D1_9ARAC|nr:hypothetical protein LAZ67_1006716 [Cordylochernes scorpioides]